MPMSPNREIYTFTKSKVSRTKGFFAQLSSIKPTLYWPLLAEETLFNEAHAYKWITLLTRDLPLLLKSPPTNSKT